MPLAYALKRHIHRYANRFWCPVDASGVLSAPVYLFPDQTSFDSDEVQLLSQTIMAGPLRLPHERVLFEVTEQLHPGASLVAYAVGTEQGVDAFLFRFDTRRKLWTDVLARASFLPDGVADVEAHPTLVDPAEHTPYFQALTGMVWRALGLLSVGTQLREHVVSPLRRASLAKHGVRGWTYRIAEIDTTQVAAAVALRGGTHASPRWHIRRGHWRTLADGRRVFVRECEVGDQSRGAVVKDYHATGLTEARLFAEAARLAHIEQPAPSPRPQEPRPDHSREVARLLEGCQPLAGTVAETYLRSRGLEVPDSPDLLFHPDLPDFETKRGWAGMVAVVRDGAGEPAGGIHRTYLLDDGSAKAPPGKKMLGPIAGGAVRLAPFPDDGRIGVAEGIETALSAQAIFGVPTMAALSADGLRRWRWPDGTTHVTIFADAGLPGMQAAATLADQLNLANISSRILAPLHGDDFNDDLRHGVTADDYAASPAADEQAQPPTTAEELLAAAAMLTNPPDMAPLSQLLGRLVTLRLEPLPERQVLGAIKSATGIAVSILEKQLGELRRRFNTTGDVNQAPIRPRWAALLRLEPSGAPERNEANVITALSLDAAFAGALVFDEFAQEILVTRALPWEPAASTLPRAWGEADDVRCAEWLQRHEINVPPVVVGRSVVAVARNIRVHPVQDYLRALAWDGTRRLDAWAVTYLGAADTPLNRAMASLWMISAVARIMRPGCKADHMLILEGPQGIRKSTALKVLASDAWFTDELAEIGSKDAAQQMRGVWIIEMAELDAIGRAEVSRIKAFLTRTSDRYRPPYERYVVTVPRQCVFAGSVNPDTYLRDETGNRRFWPLRCGEIDLDGLRRDRDQLWAEAVARFNAGAPWWLEDRVLIASATAEQEARYEPDAWDALIERWLVSERRSVNVGFGNYDDWQDRHVPRPQALTDISVGEVLEKALSIEPAKWTRADQMRVSSFLKARKWERYKSGASGRDAREWRYRAPRPEGGS